MPQPLVQKFSQLLVVMTDRHIGNLLVSLYAIKSAQAKLEAKQTLTCVIDYQLLPLARYLAPDIDFIPVAIRGKTAITVKLKLLFKLLVRLLSQRYDVAIDLYGHGESLKICRLSGAKTITAFACQPRLMGHYNWTSADAELTVKHQIDYYLYPFVPVLGLLEQTDLRAEKLPTTAAAVSHKLEQLGVNADKPLAVIHPGAGKAYKLWPISHWQQLIKLLRQKGYDVLVIGAGVDGEQVDAIFSDDSISAFNGYQQFNLIETIHLGFVAQCMIGNDSGPTHLMATTPTQVFSLFGPTDHGLWSPLSDNSHILHSGVNCLENCTKSQCQREISCLEALMPEQVFLNCSQAQTND